MAHYSPGCLFSIAIMLLVANIYSSRAFENGYKIKSATFLSPEFVLGPGSVENRFYYNIDFPKGHIALKSFNGEVIDEAGNPVPLYETYLHHWVVEKYYHRGNMVITESNHKQALHHSDYIFGRNSGICQANVLGQYFGLGSETRKTATYVPDPYGIEIGNPANIPAGYEERWLLNVHAIDTRGVEDRLGCTECRCDLYNITVGEYGRPLRPGYKGGLSCCYDHTQCKLRRGFEGVRRSLYLRYTVKWIDWDVAILPVKIFIFDVTDTGKRLNDSTEYSPENGCQVEYEVESCSPTAASDDGFTDVKRASLTMPTGGYVVYGVAHQHTGGLGSTLYREDGRVICASVPTYGKGKEAGNEAGYIIGMSTCYPKPGSVKIAAGENLILESNYSKAEMHTGVMGLFYILVADKTPDPKTLFHDLFAIESLTVSAFLQTREYMKLSTYTWAGVAFLGLAMTVAVIVHSQLKKGREDGCQPIIA